MLLGKAEQLAVEAVASQFSATWHASDATPPRAFLTVGRRRIALDFVVVAEPSPGRTGAPVRLREDVVARRVLRDIEESVSGQAPVGKTLLLTLGAPIRAPKKLVASLTKILLAYLGSGAAETDEKESILGNRVRFRVLDNPNAWSAAMVGFVFSGDVAPGTLADAMRSLHEQIAARAKLNPPTGFTGHRWLVVANHRWIADIKTYQTAFTRTTPLHQFKKILMVFDGGRVEALCGS